MAYIDPNAPMSNREFNKLAADAGFYQTMGGYSTRYQLNAYDANRQLANIASNVTRMERPESVERDAVVAQMNTNWAKQVPTSELAYATQQQRRLAESAAAAPGTQQGISMEQRNLATTGALNNAINTPGPGRSVYDQRLQQMMLGSFDSSDPSYQWRMEQALTNAGRAGAAKGMLGSGNMAAELLNLSSNLASQEYGAQFNRLLQASANATQHYTAAYGVLDRMLAQQQSQQGFGLQQEQLAQDWARIGQGWNNQNLGMFANDTSRWDAGNRAAADAGKLSLARDQFNASEKRLDQWASGESQALQQRLANLQSSPQYVAPPAPTYGYSTPSSYYAPVQNNVAPQLPSGTGYISNSSGKTTTFGNQSPAYQPWGNDYGYEAVYGD
jgi:hypothetical protein